MDESPYCWAAWSMLVLVVVVCVQGGGCPLSGARRRVGPASSIPPPHHHLHSDTLCISTWGHGHIIGAVLQIILKLSLKYPIYPLKLKLLSFLPHCSKSNPSTGELSHLQFGAMQRCIIIFVIRSAKTIVNISSYLICLI